MKKKIFTVFAGAFCLLQAHAQTTQVIDLTTGNGAVGSSDPIWTVQAVPANGGTAPMDAVISNGTVSELTELYPNSYAHNDCGRWISPYTITAAGATFGTIPLTVGEMGSYTYRMTFTATNTCPVSNAVINFTNAGADNNISKIVVNGHAHAVTGSGSTMFISLNQNVTTDIINGVNTIDVVVNNVAEATGLMLCGNLTITYSTPVAHITGATVFCEGDPLTFSGATSTGTILTYGWEIAECDASGNVAPGAPSWSYWYTGTPGSFTFGDFIGFIPNCSHHYKITLGLANKCAPWVGTSTVISLKCKPTMNVSEPPTVCEGTDVVLSVSGNAPSYTWGAPINQTANSVHITATANAAYPVTATLNGCTATAYAHTTVAPQNFDVDLSTGVNSSGGLIAFGGFEDTWKLRGYPGYITGPIVQTSSLNKLYVSQPYTSGDSINWVSSSSERWITTKTTTDGYGNPMEVAATQTNNSPDDYYYFETQFNIPYSGYNNLRIVVNDVAVDNVFWLYLNSSVLTGTSNNMEYGLYDGTMPDTNFSILHHPGIIATNQSHYVTGNNKLIAQIMNGGGPDWNGSYMGLLLNAHVKGECVPPRGRSLEISDQDMIAERTEATTFVYPNPSAGTFTIRCEDQTILSIIVRNQLGQVVKTVEGVNASSADLSLEQAQKGFYFVEIRYKEQQKPVFRKVIIE